MKTTFVSLTIAGVLSGCATGYKPDGIGGGYNDHQYAKDIFAIGVRGNGSTSADRAAQIALLRGADVTLANGFSHFVVISKSESAQTGTIKMPTQTMTTGSVYTTGNTAYFNANSTTTGGQILNFSKPRITIKIRTFHGQPAGMEDAAYDARMVCQSLGAEFGAQCSSLTSVTGTAPPSLPSTVTSLLPGVDSTTNQTPVVDTTAEGGSANRIQVNFPDGWIPKEISASLASKGIKYYFVNKTIDAGVMVSFEPRSQITDGEQYTKTVRTRQESALKDSRSSLLGTTTIGQHRAWRYWVVGKLANGVEVEYLGTVIEGQQSYALVNTWTHLTTFEAHRASLEALAENIDGY